MKLEMVVLLASALAIMGCGETQTNDAQAMTAREKLANAKRLKRACGSSETYDRLKAVTFEQAAEIRGGMSPLLDALSANTVVRMEDPLAKSRDEALNVTVCTGKFVLELPPGTEDAFDGDRRLEAEVEYTAQEAVDGSGLVYQMQGAEPIIYRLAAIDLKRGGPQVATAPVVRGGPTPALTADPQDAPDAMPRWPRAEQPGTPTAPPPPRQMASAPTPASITSRDSARPSFNCNGPRGRVTKRICANPALAARDRAMSSIFYQALAGGDAWTRSTLRSSRDRFLAFRNSCSDDRCIAQAYADRIQEIRDIAATPQG